MDAFASPSTRAESPRAGGLRWLEILLSTAVLGVSLFSVLGRADGGLDASWQVMLLHAHAQGLQFGRDIIFTWGPWGFLCSRTHFGSVAALPVLAWQGAGQFLIAFALVWLTRPLVAWRRFAYVAAVVAFHWLFQDTAYFVLIALITLSALMRPGAGPLRLVAWTLALGFLGQIKFTYLVIGSGAVLASAACWALRGSWRRAWALGGGYLFGILAAWAAAGQDLDNLVPYIRRSLEISSGYGDAMAFDESWPVFLWGSGLALACLAFAWRVWRTAEDRPFALGACAYLAFSFFVMWKESFIRADLVPLGGHVLGLFSYVLILAPAAPGLVFPGRRWHWFDGAVVLCLVAVASFDPGFYRQGPRVCWEILQANAGSLRRLGTLPQEWEQANAAAAEEASLPGIQKAVGSGTVDVYNYSVGTALLNGLALSARPVFQSYSAYTPGLEGCNLRFYQSDRAPDFLLWREERVDGRYPGQDDAMLLAALPGHFEPLFQEGGYWLFRRTSRLPAAAPEQRLILSRTVGLSEEIALPAHPAHAIWLRADAVENALGRVRGFAYKPALISLATRDDQGRRRTWRLLPRVARAGFILVPTLADGGDMALLMKGQSGPQVTSFHFEAPEGQGEFWRRIEVSVFEMPGLALAESPGAR